MIESRLRIIVRGAVQGVGYRPFVFRLAAEHGLNGWVLNSSQGVFIEVEGPQRSLASFEQAIRNQKPPLAIVQSIETWWLDPVGFRNFEIKHSDGAGEKSVLVMPDVATCPDCLSDITDPSNRRYRYPFTNCTNCGPRYSIIQALPYDRPNTTMKAFPMCSSCLAEYENPADRRFHAQPNACPVCGPQVALWDGRGSVVARGQEAVLQVASAVLAGQIVAVKGLGGFHLAVDAFNESAVAELRRRKRREFKPLAVMAPSLATAEELCYVDQVERAALLSLESPIVLLRRRLSGLAQSVAPQNPNLGVMLPYTPLHHLLLREIGGPIVATSGNLTDEPICTDEREALDRLRGIADLFLVHNRPIERQVDDSVVRVIEGRPMVLRRARGYAPLPVPLRGSGEIVVGVGAHLKSAVAISVGDKAFISQHIGDLETVEAVGAFDRVVAGIEGLYGAVPSVVACDLHPDYASTRKALSLGIPVVKVQHHLAHALACAADNDLEPPYLAVSWDGTGLGTDGTIWGGEFLVVSDAGWERVGWLQPFRLPGGDRAAREPWRAAVSVLMECGIEPLPILPFTDVSKIHAQLNLNANCPVTTSAGRLFDAVSTILGICGDNQFEGQAAMELEFCACGQPDKFVWPQAPAHPPLPLDWRPLIRSMVQLLEYKAPIGEIAMFFHQALASGIAQFAAKTDQKRVLLTGGCFQNRILLENTIRELRESGLEPYWHQRIPPNDGGIAVGQVVEAIRQRKKHVLSHPRTN